jgi:MoxR-like ATPase
MLPQAMKQALASVGYYSDDSLATEMSLLMAQETDMIRTMILDGPPGAGKSALAKAVAKIYNAPFIYVQAHSGSSPEDFLLDANIVAILRGASGDRSAVKSPEDVISFGFIPTVFKASQSGRIISLVEELDKATQKVDAFFLTALQEAEVMIRGISKPITANVRNLTLFFTKNNEREVSEALMRRCRRVYLKFPPTELEMKILAQAGVKQAIAQVLTNIASKLRQKQDDLIKVPATQELVMAGLDTQRLGQWGCIHMAGDIVFRWLAAYQEDQQILKKMLPVETLNNMLKIAYKAASASSQDEHTRPDESFLKFGK